MTYSERELEFTFAKNRALEHISNRHLSCEYGFSEAESALSTQQHTAGPVQRLQSM